MKDWKRYLVLWLLCLFLNTALYTSAEEDKLELYARSAVLMDGDSGRILYGKNPEQELPMASTTKIMTCIIALEQMEMDTICLVTENAQKQPKVKLGMERGMRFYLEDLLYSLMLESHNDSAVCIAETVGGSVEGFAKLMNQKAAEIGCENTYYITPNGLDAQDQEGIHHTTASDLAKVMRYCMTQSPKSEEFQDITKTSDWQFSDLDQKRIYSCRNHNTLLTILEGARSGKTGFTGKAGYCYVGVVEQDEKLLILSLLACGWPGNKGYKWVDSKKLVRYGTEHFERQEIGNQKFNVVSLPVAGGEKGSVKTKIDWEEEFGEKNSRTVLLKKGENLICKVEYEKELKAPVEEGTVVGHLYCQIDGQIYGTFPMIATEKIEKKRFLCGQRNLCKKFVNLITKRLAFFS